MIQRLAPEILGTGLAFPFGIASPRGGIALASGERDVAEAIRIILSTTPGERVMRPEFGCDLLKFVFEHVDAALLTQIERAIRRSLHRWEPRVSVESVTFEMHEDRTALLIDVVYLLRSTMTRRNLVYPFYLVPAEEHA